VEQLLLELKAVNALSCCLPAAAQLLLLLLLMVTHQQGLLLMLLVPITMHQAAMQPSQDSLVQAWLQSQLAGLGRSLVQPAPQWLSWELKLRDMQRLLSAVVLTQQLILSVNESLQL